MAVVPSPGVRVAIAESLIRDRGRVSEWCDLCGRSRSPWKRVSLHIQKPKPHASIKNKLEKIHKLLDVYNTIHKKWE